MLGTKGPSLTAPCDGSIFQTIPSPTDPLRGGQKVKMSGPHQGFKAHVERYRMPGPWRSGFWMLLGCLEKPRSARESHVKPKEETIRTNRPSAEGLQKQYVPFCPHCFSLSGFSACVLASLASLAWCNLWLIWFVACLATLTLHS